MKTYVLCLLIFLSACANVSPADIRVNGAAYEFVTKLPPAAAAACVARNVENAGNAIWGYVAPNVREGAKPGTAEMTAVGLLAADFAPAGTGSLATVHMAPQVLQFIQDKYLGAFHGC